MHLKPDHFDFGVWIYTNGTNMLNGQSLNLFRNFSCSYQI